MAQSISSTRGGSTVELGPRSMALLRRLVLGIELLIDSEIADPGEDAEVTELDQVDLTVSTDATTTVTRTVESALLG